MFFYWEQLFNQFECGVGLIILHCRLSTFENFTTSQIHKNSCNVVYRCDQHLVIQFDISGQNKLEVIANLPNGVSEHSGWIASFILSTRVLGVMIVMRDLRGPHSTTAPLIRKRSFGAKFNDKPDIIAFLSNREVPKHLDQQARQARRFF